MGNSNLALNSWNRVSKLPMGKSAWSKLVASRAPYFRSISPQMLELRPGYAEAALKKRWSVTNHLGTVHAIAMCNLAEFAGGLMTEVSVPATHRWIPKGMTVEYLRKAGSDLRGICDAPLPAFGDEVFDWPVTVNVLDRDQQTVFRAIITMWISAKK
ncbi:MAG: hotdog fold domain-containing protein [Panacagrimonas sp.]